MSANNSHGDRPFVGQLAEYMAWIVKERHRLGFKFGEEERLLHELDELSIGYECTGRLPENLVRKFVERKPNWHQGTQEHHLQTARILALYLIRHDVPAFVPDKSMITNLHGDYKPYIFSHEETAGIFGEADKAKPSISNSNVFYPTIFRLQYGCGLRISETLGLQMRDVDMMEKVIHVKDAKNHKDRDVPFSDSVGAYLEWYAGKVHPIYQDNEYFFQSHWGDGKYSISTVSNYFREVLRRCGIRHGGRKNGGPHLHCLRHTFCCHSLENMLRGGTSHQAAIPLLMTYLGHSSPSATGYYLKLTAEAFPDLREKINELYGNMLPDMEVRLNYEDD